MTSTLVDAPVTLTQTPEIPFQLPYLVAAVTNLQCKPNHLTSLLLTFLWLPVTLKTKLLDALLNYK